MIMVKVAAVMRRAKWDMGTSTPGLAHAIATRRPDRVAPDPRGASAGAPRPAASRWRFVAAGLLARGSAPTTRPSRCARWPDAGVGSPLTVAGAATAWAIAAPCSRHRHAQNYAARLQKASGLNALRKSTRSDCANRERTRADRGDPPQGIEREPAVLGEAPRGRDLPRSLGQVADHGE